MLTMLMYSRRLHCLSKYRRVRTRRVNFKEALDAGAGSRARNNYAAFLYAQGRYLEAAEAFREVTTDTLYSGRPSIRESRIGLAADSGDPRGKVCIQSSPTNGASKQHSTS